MTGILIAAAVVVLGFYLFAETVAADREAARRGGPDRADLNRRDREERYGRRWPS